MKTLPQTQVFEIRTRQEAASLLDISRMQLYRLEIMHGSLSRCKNSQLSRVTNLNVIALWQRAYPERDIPTGLIRC